MSAMDPTIVLGAMAPDGSPPLPAALGGVTVWSRVVAYAIGACPAWEFRDTLDAPFVTIQLVAQIDAARAVWLAWVPADVRGAPANAFVAMAPGLLLAGVLTSWWPVAADGTVPALEADGGADALTALAAWPPAWRLRLDADAPGDPRATPPVPPGPPSGPRCIGAALA